MRKECEKYEELIAIEALHALDPEEETELMDHIRECPRCEAELSQLSEVVSFLGNEGASAPEGIWEKIESNLSKEPPPLKLVVGPPSATKPKVVRTLAAALAAALLVLLGTVGAFSYDIHSLNSKIATMNSNLEASGLNGAIANASASPTTKRIVLASSDGKRYITTLLTPSGQSYITASNLPSLSSGYTYQLWGLVAGSPVSLGLLGPKVNKMALEIGPNTTQLMVTVEPEGGVLSPTSSVLVQGKIPTTSA